MPLADLIVFLTPVVMFALSDSFYLKGNLVFMTDQSLRRRVERILSGEPMAPHLDRLFLYVRDRCDGRETVQEIGDFVAHHNERTKGVLTRSARDFFTVIGIKLQYLDRNFDITDLPSNFVEFTRAIARMLSANVIKRETGLSRSKFTKRLEVLIPNFKIKANGNVYYDAQITKEDEAILTCIVSYFVVKSAFNSVRLIDDFISVLQSNGLLRKNEVRQMKSLAPQVIMHVIACMHGCVIILSDGSKSFLNCSKESSRNTLSIMSKSKLVTADGKIINALFSIFSTDLDFDSYISEELKAERVPWDFAIQLSSNNSCLEKL